LAFICLTPSHVKKMTSGIIATMGTLSGVELIFQSWCQSSMNSISTPSTTTAAIR
jgi:hypothetical protein